MSDRVSQSRGSHARPRNAQQSPPTESEAGNPRRRRSSLRQRHTATSAAIRWLGSGLPASTRPSPSFDSRRAQAPPLSPSLEDRTHLLLAGKLPPTPRTPRVLQLRLRRLHQTRLPLDPTQTVLKPALGCNLLDRPWRGSNLWVTGSRMSCVCVRVSSAPSTQQGGTGYRSLEVQ